MRVSRGALLAGGVGIAAASTLVARQAGRRRRDAAPNPSTVAATADAPAADTEATPDPLPKEPGDLPSAS